MSLVIYITMFFLSHLYESRLFYANRILIKNISMKETPRGGSRGGFGGGRGGFGGGRGGRGGFGGGRGGGFGGGRGRDLGPPGQIMGID
jgi:hypothetical protein